MGGEADTIRYNTVILAFAEAPDVARAEHCMSMMLKAGILVDTIRYNTVNKARADTRDVTRVEPWMSMM